MANKITDRMEAAVESGARGEAGFSIGSVWDWECLDKQGNVKWRETTRNTVQRQGLVALLNIMFNGQASPGTSWYVTLFESDTAMTAGTATYATKVFTECTAYAEGTRGKFTQAAATTAGTCSITNSASKASFTMNDTKTVYGGALVGGTSGTAMSTKNDTTSGGGILFAASKFTAAKAVVADDIINLTVTINVISG